MNILGRAQTPASKAATWAEFHDAPGWFVDLADTYWRYAPQRGVIPEVAYCQAAKETGFGRFGGVIDASYCNPCGLKTASGGANDDPDAHQHFHNWHVGIIAHLDHLALYAGALSYPRTDTPDPRHFVHLLGIAKTVESLGGKWAPSSAYGTAIVAWVKELRA